MKKPLSTAPFEYSDGPDRRVLNLELDWIPSVPAFGCSHYSSKHPIVEKHVHPGCVEILYCSAGNLYFDCEDEEYMLMPGELLVVQPEVHHRLSVNPKKMFLYWLYLRLESEEGTLLNQSAGEASALHDALTSIPVRIFRAASRVQSDFQHLFEVYDSMAKGEFRSLCMRSIVLDLLLSVIASANQGLANRRDGHIESVAVLIRNAPEKNFDWDLIAHDCHMSKNLFMSRFKDMTGLPPHGYVIFCRMRKARDMLLNKSLSITDIAYDLGFSSSQHFSMQFRRQFGVTPTQWRESQ